MVGRIGPSSFTPRPCAPKPKGLIPDAEDLTNFMKACAGGSEWGIKSFFKDWPSHTGVYYPDTNMTCLLVAAQNGRGDAVKLLVDFGCDIRATNNEGANALMMAAQSSNESLVEWLLGKGFRADAKDKEGRTALHHFVFGGNDRDSNIPAILIKAGADINAASPAGVKPLQWALTQGRKMAFRILLDLGADISDPMLAAFASQMDSGDFSAMLREEPARREKAVEDAVSGGIDKTLKVSKPFNLSKKPKTEGSNPPPPASSYPLGKARGFSL